MATPKKKISRSRRNMRRFAGGNRLDKTTVIKSSVDNELTRPHRITKALLDSGRYLEATAGFKKRAGKSAQT